MISEKTREKLRKNNAKYWLGKKRSPETIEKLRKSALKRGVKPPVHKGKEHPFYGKTEEKSHQWKGDGAGIDAMHEWVKR